MSRQYNDPCGIARALDLVGERWALLVVRELLLGPKRFTDLRNGLGDISPNVLSQRLDDLTERGVIETEYLGPPASTSAYQLTDLGRGLEPVLVALGQWGASLPQSASRAELSTDALWLAMQTTANLKRPCPSGDYQLTVDGDTVTANVTRTALTMRRGSAPRPKASLDADSATMRAIIFGDRDITGAIGHGACTVDGDHDAATAFVALFERPAPAT